MKNSSTIETVILLSQLKPDDVIHIDVELDELDTTASEMKPTYDDIKKYILDKYNLKVSSLYISQIRRKKNLEVGESFNKPKSENSKQPNCPKEKADAIEDVLMIDCDLSDLINQRKNELYEKYSYLKPECEKITGKKFEDGIKKAGEWCKEHWKLIATVVLVIAAVVVIIVCPASAVLLLGAAKGLLSGALIGGLIGGISSAAAGKSFLDGFEDGAFSGALTGALFGGLGAGGQLFGKAFRSSCRVFDVIKHTSRITGVLSLGMGAFDVVAAEIGMFDPSNPLVKFNQKLHSSTIYNVAQFGVSIIFR